jgi:hypothetical protein
MTRPLAFSTCLAGLLLLAAPAFAREADDLQRMIDSARQNTRDLERLDELGAVREEITLMRSWLDQSWRLRSEQKYDDTRVVLDRVDAQAEMIREKITASKLSAAAAKKEAALAKAKAQLTRTQQALQKATLDKAGLEARGR